jgi:hypothetical protein
MTTRSRPLHRLPHQSSPQITLSPSTLNWTEYFGSGEYGSEALAIRLWWYGIIVVENVFAEEAIRKQTTATKQTKTQDFSSRKPPPVLEGGTTAKKTKGSWLGRPKKSKSMSPPSSTTRSGDIEISGWGNRSPGSTGEELNDPKLSDDDNDDDNDDDTNSDVFRRSSYKGKEEEEEEVDGGEEHIHVSPKKTLSAQNNFQSDSLDTWVTATAFPIFEDSPYQHSTSATPSSSSPTSTTSLDDDSIAEGARLRGLVRAFSLLVGARETASHDHRVVRERLNGDIATVKSLMEETEDGRYVDGR